MVSMAFAQQDTLQLVTQFDAHSLKIRWITTDVNALRRGFNEGWQLIIYPQNSNQPVYQERIRPLTDNALADLIHSGSDSLVFSIYQNIRSGQTFFTDAADREWQQLGFLFGLADNFMLSKALALGHEITGEVIEKGHSPELSGGPQTRLGLSCANQFAGPGHL